MDTSPFLNWNEKRFKTVDEQADVFWSLVATVKLQPVLDDSLEAKAVKFLESVDPDDEAFADAFFVSLQRTSDEVSTDLIQSIIILICTPSHVITTAAMEMLENLLLWCSPNIRLTLVTADLIPQLINTLNPLSLSFAEAVGIHTSLVVSISESNWLATLNGLEFLEIEYEDEQQAVHETVLKQVLVPSEQYLYRLCANRFSIVDGKQSKSFLVLLAHLLEISPYGQSTMEFVFHMPVALAIPSCLTFFEADYSIWFCLFHMNNPKREWNEQGGKVQRMWKTVHRMLRMEGIEDVIDEKLRSDQNESDGEYIVFYTIEFNNLLGTNVPRLW
ncbi:hypothetical protein BLNAU_16329 [Blattamonas nauphoetae]|uniref:Uncharacterized protein n=1 Tax=Blattamonas nauphoetae TaxID=2049346 RepID=A0ABQ9X9U4_9EUKA|nr:hypothetical protein BLNAU_16329 [Blattamonas nauphoetae]